MEVSTWEEVKHVLQKERFEMENLIYQPFKSEIDEIFSILEKIEQKDNKALIDALKITSFTLNSLLKSLNTILKNLDRGGNQ